MDNESYHRRGAFCISANKSNRMKEMLAGAGIILLMWMIISAGMIEISGKTGILWGAVITGVILLSIYVYGKNGKFR